MPFKSEKQKRWMYANKPKMAKKWEKKVKEQKLNENPAVIATAARAAIEKAKEKDISPGVKVKTAANNPNHKDHKKAKGIIQRIRDKAKAAIDKVKNKKGKETKKAEPKKQSKSDADHYARQFGVKENAKQQLKMFFEKNVPTNPTKWSYYKSRAKEKFDVYPSAYANAWAVDQYNDAGGGWKKEKKKKKEQIGEAKIKRWEQIPKSGTIDFGKYGRFVILSTNDLRVSGKFVSGSAKSNRTITFYSDKGKTYYRKRKGLSISDTPSFPFDNVKSIKESEVNERMPYKRSFKGQRKTGDNYLGGSSDNRGNRSELYQAKDGKFYIWVQSGGAEGYIDLPKNIKDRGEADDIHLNLRDKFRKKKPIKVKGKTLKPESVNEDLYYGYYKNKEVKVNAKSDKDAKKQIISKLKIPKGDLNRASMINHTKNQLKLESVNEDVLNEATYVKGKMMVILKNSFMDVHGGLVKNVTLSDSLSDEARYRLGMFQKRMSAARENYVKAVMRASKPFDKEITGV